jgi:hypothetical protein
VWVAARKVLVSPCWRRHKLCYFVAYCNRVKIREKWEKVNKNLKDEKRVLLSIFLVGFNRLYLAALIGGNYFSVFLGEQCWVSHILFLLQLG